MHLSHHKFLLYSELLDLFERLGFINAENNKKCLKEKNLAVLKDSLGLTPLHNLFLDQESHKRALRWRTPTLSIFNSIVCYKNGYQKADLRLLEQLIELKADINAKNSNHITPFHFACQNTSISFDEIKWLVENKADLNDINANEENGLYIYIKFNSSLKVIDYLLEMKSSLDFLEYGYNPLHVCCLNDKPSLEVIKYFCEKNIYDINSRGEYDDTPLLYACERNGISVEFLKYLLEQKADINIPTEISPLFRVLYNTPAPLDVVKFLVEMKGNVLEINSDGENVLHFYLSNQKIEPSLEVVKYLVESKVDFDRLNDYDTSPLFYHCSNFKGSNFEIVQYLVENKANISVEEGKRSLLEVVIENSNYLGLIKYLVEKKVDVNHVSCENNYNLVQQSCKSLNPSLQVTKYLIEELKLDYSHSLKQSPNLLHIACSNEIQKVPDLIKYLLEITPSNVLNDFFDGSTALHCLFGVSLQKIEPQTFKELLIHFVCSGANFHLKDLQNLNAIDLLRQTEHQSIVLVDFARNLELRDIWSIHNHMFFPKNVRSKIYCFIISIKLGAKKYSLRFPKFLLYLIISFFVSTMILN